MASTTRGAGSASTPVGAFRRRLAAALLVSVAALIAGLVSLALVAEGREVSHASSNDGGAWLINRQLGVVGHRNRAAGELSAFLRFSDNPSAEIHQAKGIVVVHDPDAGLLYELDQRNFTDDAEPTLLPPGTELAVSEGSVFIVQPDEGRVWRVAPEHLPTIPDLSLIQPALDLTGPISTAVSPDGRMAAIDGDNQLHWLLPSGQQSVPFTLDLDDVINLSIVEASAVALSSTGQVVVAGVDQIEHSVTWQGADLPVVLQQPAVDISEAELRPAERVVLISGEGTVSELVLADSPTIETRASLGGTRPLPPVVHQGCTYAVVTDPALFSIICDDVQTRRLTGAGTELQLRLVNGWVWLNDLTDGGTWVANATQEVELLDDWGLAERALSDDAESNEPDAAPRQNAERTLIADADASGPVRDSDDFNPTDANVPPIAVNDVARTRVDRVAVVSVLDNDRDLNNDILVISTAQRLSGEASISIGPDGRNIQVAPNPGFVGTVELEYWISDGRSEPVSAFVALEVAPVDAANTPPTTNTDVVATAPGHATTIDVLANDFDPDGDAIALVGIEATDGTLRWSANGQITYTPDTTTSAGWIELPYTIADDLGAETTGVVRVEIRDRGANQEPDARNDQAVTIAGRPAIINVLENDSDPDGDTLIVASRPVLLAPADAEIDVTASPDGEVIFRADVAGSYVLAYTVTDSAEGGSEQDTAQIRVDVLPAEANVAPVAMRDDVVLAAGDSQVVYVLENDGDADGDVVSIVDWQATAGLLITEYFDEAGHIGFRIAAEPDAPVRSRFLYSISDGVNEPVSAPVVVTVINRRPFDQPPIASDDRIEIRAGSTIERVDALRNDFDPEGGSLRIVALGLPATSVDSAQIDIAPGGETLRLTVPAGVTRGFSFSYDVEDEAGNRAAAVVQVQIISPDAPNRPPIARADEARTVTGAPVLINPIANDSDPDGDPVLLQGIVAQPSFGTATIVDGLLRYQPDEGFTGTDVIRYAIVDTNDSGAQAEVRVGVVGFEESNQAPVANDDAFTLADSGGAVPLQVRANDFDPEGDPIRVVSVTNVSLGKVSVDDFGRVEFIPPERLAQPTDVTFSYTIADTAGNRDSAIVVVSLPALDGPPEPETPVELPVTPPPVEPEPEATPEPTPTPTPPPAPPLQPDNEPPVAVSDDLGPLAPGTTEIVDALANDYDPDGEPGTLTIVDVGAGGRISGGFIEVVAGAETTQIEYVIEDAGGLQATGTITVAVTENQAPEVQPFLTEVAFETPVTIDLSAQAFDADGDPLFFVCCDAIRGGSISQVVAAQDQLTLVFTPTEGFVGQGGFSYSVDDQQGHQVGGSASITVAAAGNSAPEALPDTVDVPQGATVAIDLDLLVFDADSDQLAFSIDQDPGLGIQAELSASTILVTVPREAVIGGTTELGYSVSDGPESASAVISLVVTTGANRPPVANGTTLDLPAGTGTTIDLNSLASDPDTGDSLAWSLDVLQTSGLDATLTGSLLQLDAAADAPIGFNQVAYTVTDRQGEFETATVTVQVVAPTAPLPQAIADTATAREGVAVTIDVLANDVDPLGQGLTIVGATSDAGQIQVVGNELRFTSAELTGSLALQYTVADVAGREASATVIVQTTGAPEQPAPPGVDAESGQVIISWDTPAERGAEITGYTIRSNTGEVRTAGLVNSFLWNGLTNGTEYTFTVTAETAIGPSPESGPSLPATPDELPGTPGPPTVVFDDGELAVSWNAPENDGSAITGYELEIGGALSEVQAVPGTTYRWTGLTNGEAYTFRVRAVNAQGGGSFSAPSSPEIPAGPPGVVSGVVAQRGNLSGSLVVDWATPADTNGADIINYRIVPSIGSPVETGSDLTTYNWSNLTNGDAVSYRVQAQTKAGWGPLSAPSAAVVPCGAPLAPSTVSAERGDRQVSIAIGETPDNGCLITGYVVTNNEGEVRNFSGSDAPFNAFLWTDLTNGTPYTFTVRAVNELGAGEISAETPSVIPAGAPLCRAGSTMSANASGVGEITLTWTDAIANGDALTLYQINYEGGSIEVEPDLTTTIDSLPEATTYTFEVQALNSVGVSPVCGSATATTWAPPTALTATLVVTGESSDEVQATVAGGLSPSNPITSWNAEIGLSTGGVAQNWDGVDQVPSSFSYTATEDGEYQFELSVCNAVGCVQVVECCESVTLVGPPGTMQAPQMNYEYTPWTNFGVQVSTVFTPPDDNGGSPITEYLWELQWIGSSGTWHYEDGSNGTDLEREVAFWPGYSSHPQGTTQGQSILWEVRVAAVNSEGQGEWSEWGSLAPPLRSPEVLLIQGSGASCPTTPPSGTFVFCHELELELHGFPRNRVLDVIISPDPGLTPENCAGAVAETGNQGDFPATEIGCAVIGPTTLTAEVDGYFSPPLEVSLE